MIQAAEVVVGISILIFLHELGHFVAAKRCGVRVEVFSLGFGAAIVSFKHGGTDYRLCWIPLGGYVKMAGESTEDEQKGLPDEFLSKPPGRRAVILSAGVLMNALFAMLAFVVAFSVGLRFTPCKIGYVERGSPAWSEGILPGDIIRKVNGREISDFEDLIPTIAFSSAGESLAIGIERDGQRLVKYMQAEYDEYRGLPRLGVQPASSLEIQQIFKFDGKCPARDAGLQVYDRIVAANGPVRTWADLRDVLTSNAEKPVKLKVEREGRIVHVTVVPAPVKRWMIGLTCQTARIAAIRKESPAYQGGLRAGDQILQVKGRPVSGWADIVHFFQESHEPNIPFAAKRGGGTIEGAIAAPKDVSGEDILADIVPVTGLVIDSLLKGFPAEAIGLEVGDRVVSLEPKRVSPLKRLLKRFGFCSGVLRNWDDLHDAVANSGGQALLATYMRSGREYVTEIKPTRTDFGAGGQIGITPRRETVLRRYGLVESVRKGFHKSIVSVKQVYLTLRGLATRRVAGKNVGGIVAIAQASYYKAKEGVVELLYLLGIISVQLAVLNVLPIPVLDGGHLLFLVIEKIKGSPVSQKVQIAANYVGLAILLTLVAYATRNDILRLLS